MMSNMFSDYNFYLTGSLRDVANAAWISTMDKTKAEERSDDDVDRVTTFLAKNAHTSPFEAVTITTRVSCDIFDSISDLLKDCKFFNFVKKEKCDGFYLLTTDLLNFFKTNVVLGLENDMWVKFKKEFEQISSKLEMLPLKGNADLNSSEKQSSVADNFEHSNIEVDLVSVHDPFGEDIHKRITWRVKCPLSIGVQMLRHRTGSFNMVSGRYKTIRQEFTNASNDLIDIFEKSDLLTEARMMREFAEQTKEFYLDFMKKIAEKKKEGVMSNEEYKRCREFVRFILPEGRMTELYVTFYKSDFDHFLKLRNSDHTQPEHIYVAQLMKKTYESYLK